LSRIIVGKHFCRCGWCGTQELDDLDRLYCQSNVNKASADNHPTM
jgi:hypothetical protein